MNGNNGIKWYDFIPFIVLVILMPSATFALWYDLITYLIGCSISSAVFGWIIMGVFGYFYWPFYYRKVMTKEDWQTIYSWNTITILTGPWAILFNFPL